ncbi:chemotaxis protein CheW [Bacterioplanoides pacificum]|uniref:Chemotaxis protein CheW n=1 Tax=Bacterioplanoides pacificum TaxID=1171596 RepID=A0ABV7VW12_9GAMM
MTSPVEQKTANQVDDVLQGYLDQLLVTATEPLTVVAEVSTPTSEVAPEVVKEAVAEPLVSLAPTPSVVSADSADSDMTVATAVSGGPDWRAVQGVECLIFKVAGLKLAIPLAVLGGVYNRSEQITPLFGQASWSLGVWQSDEQKLTIVDSAALIMPERGISMAEQGYDFVIQLDRSPWALACQEICDTMTLTQESIKWRGDCSKRPWLAGTVISEMCALIDVTNLLDMLEQNTRS